MLAIIGGTGLNQLPNLTITRRKVVRTPYGEPSCGLTFGEINGKSVMFLARHGYGHTLQPHEINYRANIWALYEQEVDQIVAVNSVGGIRHDLVPGVLVIPDQIIDYTYGRAGTYFEGATRPVTHIDFTEPYCAKTRACLVEAGRRANTNVIDGGTYACTQGPRLESAAEIGRLERDGADMVGMTGMPEAALARELNLSYASLGVVVNFAAGKGNSIAEIDFAKALSVMEATMPSVMKVLAEMTTAAKVIV